MSCSTIPVTRARVARSVGRLAHWAFRARRSRQHHECHRRHHHTQAGIDGDHDHGVAESERPGDQRGDHPVVKGGPGPCGGQGILSQPRRGPPT